jgi:hypothetical protein
MAAGNEMVAAERRARDVAAAEEVARLLRERGRVEPRFLPPPGRDTSATAVALMVTPPGAALTPGPALVGEPLHPDREAAAAGDPAGAADRLEAGGAAVVLAVLVQPAAVPAVDHHASAPLVTLADSSRFSRSSRVLPSAG